jgi:hypothetical protein
LLLEPSLPLDPLLPPRLELPLEELPLDELPPDEPLEEPLMPLLPELLLLPREPELLEPPRSSPKPLPELLPPELRVLPRELPGFFSCLLSRFLSCAINPPVWEA